MKQDALAWIAAHQPSPECNRATLKERLHRDQQTAEKLREAYREDEMEWELLGVDGSVHSTTRGLITQGIVFRQMRSGPKAGVRNIETDQIYRFRGPISLGRFDTLTVTLDLLA